MRSQHRAYVQTLESLGLEVLVLDPLPGYPDAYFVEDVAVILPQIAVITRPGAAARQGEQIAIEAQIARRRRLARIESPGTLDGGDVLTTGEHFFIGLSERTNRAGAGQLGRILEMQGYTWTLIRVGAGLHLKSSVTYVGDNTLLVSQAFAQHEAFREFDKIVLEEAEEAACNSLWINDHLVIPTGFPGARRKLEPHGLPVIELDISEARKMDGGLTCMSLRFSEATGQRSSPRRKDENKT
jgi:dimethylargininase